MGVESAKVPEGARRVAHFHGLVDRGGIAEHVGHLLADDHACPGVTGVRHHGRPEAPLKHARVLFEVAGDVDDVRHAVAGQAGRGAGHLVAVQVPGEVSLAVSAGDSGRGHVVKEAREQALEPLRPACQQRVHLPALGTPCRGTGDDGRVSRSNTVTRANAGLSARAASNPATLPPMTTACPGPTQDDARTVPLRRTGNRVEARHAECGRGR